MDKLIRKNLDVVLGNSLVEQRDPFKTNIWGEIDTGMLGEIPMRRNPITGKMEPVDGYPEGPVHGGWGHYPTLPKPAPGWGHHPDWGERPPGWGHHPTLPKPAPGWGHHPMPPKPAPGWGHHYPRVKTMEWNYERDGYPRGRGW